MPVIIPAFTAAITDGCQSAPIVPVPASTPINISIVAKEMAKSTGIKLTDGQLKLAGREMAKAYRKTYNADPPEHKQFV
jgi:hypothetical protein